LLLHALFTRDARSSTIYARYSEAMSRSTFADARARRAQARVVTALRLWQRGEMICDDGAARAVCVIARAALQRDT